MSMENVKKFYELALKDEELKKELKRINERITVKQSDFVEIRKLVEKEILPLAEKRGLDFTADELVSFANEQYTKLSEEDLLEVSGGLSTRNTAIGLSTVLLLSLGATSAINLLSHNDDLSQSISMSAPDETSENESQPNEEEKDNGDSQNEAKSEKSEEANAQNNSGEESTSAQVQQGEDAANNNVNSEAKDAEAQDENVADAEEAMAQGEESMFGRLQDAFDQGRFDYEENVGQKESYSHSESFWGNPTKRHKVLVADLAERLRRIGGNLDNIEENDQDRFKRDVQEAFGWMYSQDGSYYAEEDIGNRSTIQKDDYEIISKFANDYGLTGDDGEGWVEEQVPYRALGSLEFRSTMVADMAKYLRDIKEDLKNVPESDRDQFIKDVKFVADNLYENRETHEIGIKNWLGTGIATVDQSDAQLINSFYRRVVLPMENADEQQMSYKGQSLIGDMKFRKTLVGELADYLRSISGNLDNVKESDRAKLKEDVKKAFGWIFEKSDGSGYGVQMWMGGTTSIEKADYEAITEFANEYGCTGHENDEDFVPAEEVLGEQTEKNDAVTPQSGATVAKEVAYKKLSSLSSRSTMVKNVGDYLEEIGSDINKVREKDREDLKNDIEFLMKNLRYVESNGFEIRTVSRLIYSKVDTASAERIIEFYKANYESKGESPEGGSSAAASATDREEVAPTDAVAEQNSIAAESREGIAYNAVSEADRVMQRGGRPNTDEMLTFKGIKQALQFWEDLGPNRSVEMIKESDRESFEMDMFRCLRQAVQVYDEEVDAEGNQGINTLLDYIEGSSVEDLLKMDFVFAEIRDGRDKDNPIIAYSDEHGKPTEKLTQRDIELMKEYVKDFPGWSNI